MHDDEKTNWASDGTFLESRVGDGTGTNDATKFGVDFSGDAMNPAIIPSTATAVIISDDPFFQANRAALISAANTWLDGGQRYIIYPSTIYAKAIAADGTTIVRPRKDKSTLLGPDLPKAFQLLGVLANRLVSDRTLDFGFFTVPSVTIPISS